MNVDGIENRTNWPNTGEITVNEAGAVAGVCACDGCADVQSRPIATTAENGPGTEFMAVRFAGLSLGRSSTAKPRLSRRGLAGGHGARCAFAHPPFDMLSCQNAQ